MNRIDSICKLITKHGIIADIGCDHGKVSAYIVKNNLADVLIVNDISAPSLDKARQRLDKINCRGGNLPPDIKFLCCDGAELQKDLDLAIITGVGGKNIGEIVQAITPQNLIVSPQKNAPELRQTLIQLGYQCVYDEVITDKKKSYILMKWSKKCQQ